MIEVINFYTCCFVRTTSSAGAL